MSKAILQQTDTPRHAALRDALWPWSEQFTILMGIQVLIWLCLRIGFLMGVESVQ